MLSIDQINQFIRNGYLILKQAATPEMVEKVRATSHQHLRNRVKPFELESSVQYPGSPSSESAEGGDTIRRLLQIYARDNVYKQWGEIPFIVNSIKQLLHCEQVFLNPNHHNTVMTKQADFSSQTNWHRDTRYWNFNNKYLINAWLALGSESRENGALLVLPGSHRWDEASVVLDQQQFLIEDHPANKSRLSMAQTVNLEAGDCLLFSAHCFHAAASNKTDKTKMSLVFTYHGETTHAIKGTNSDNAAAIAVG